MRKCEMCNDINTYVNLKNCECWYKYNNGYICQSCHDRLKYRKKVGNLPPKPKSMWRKWVDKEITYKEYFDYMAKNNGYNNSTEYNRGMKNQLSISENKDCASYLGVHISEGAVLLSNVFGVVIPMPYSNVGYDYTCGKGFKVDVKSCCMKGEDYRYWTFYIFKNEIPDYFLFMGFDNRHDLNLLHSWLIKSDEIIETKHTKCKLNDKHALVIMSTDKSLSYFKKYELTDKLEKLRECCKSLR